MVGREQGQGAEELRQERWVYVAHVAPDRSAGVQEGGVRVAALVEAGGGVVIRLVVVLQRGPAEATELKRGAHREPDHREPRGEHRQSLSRGRVEEQAHPEQPAEVRRRPGGRGCRDGWLRSHNAGTGPEGGMDCPWARRRVRTSTQPSHSSTMPARFRLVTTRKGRAAPPWGGAKPRRFARGSVRPRLTQSKG